MKNTFKPLALAAAVAAAGTAQAQIPVGGVYPSLGDAAFVPYYTVEGDWVTGVHITNTSDDTQVVKIRLRRAEDSVDVLDFNLILSPYDVWTGTLRGDDEVMRFVTEDNSCTAPELLPFDEGRTYAPIFEDRIEGAQEGYIEIIGMGQAEDEDEVIAIYAEHGSDGVPLDCDIVRENFFVDALLDNDETMVDSDLIEDDEDPYSYYDDTDNVLKVSYFIRDNASGIEFGNNAMHFVYFGDEAMMSHQEYGLENYVNASNEQVPANVGNDSLIGWDFPDVRGGGWNTDSRYSFYLVRLQLGAEEIINDWSYNPATGAATDWVVTFPGQYAMIDYYLDRFGPANAVWDYRELPVTAEFKIWDREEDSGVPGGLGFSPSPAPDTTTLEYEVNVIEWGGLEVLNSNYVTAVNPAENQIDSPYGWATLSVTGRSGPANGVLGAGVNGWCDVAAGEFNADGDVASADGACDMYSVSGPVPMVGFAAWERTFAEDTDRNYGRIVEHSFTTSFN